MDVEGPVPHHAVGEKHRIRHSCLPESRIFEYEEKGKCKQQGRTRHHYGMYLLGVP